MSSPFSITVDTAPEQEQETLTTPSLPAPRLQPLQMMDEDPDLTPERRQERRTRSMWLSW